MGIEDFVSRTWKVVPSNALSVDETVGHSLEIKQVNSTDAVTIQCLDGHPRLDGTYYPNPEQIKGTFEGTDFVITFVPRIVCATTKADRPVTGSWTAEDTSGHPDG